MHRIAALATREAGHWKPRALSAEEALEAATERAKASEEDAALARAGRRQAQAEASRARALLEELEAAGEGDRTTHASSSREPSSYDDPDPEYPELLSIPENSSRNKGHELA